MSGTIRIAPSLWLLSFLCAGLCCFAIQAAAEEVSRSAGESDAQFVKRVTGQDLAMSGWAGSGTEQLAKTTAFIKGAEALVAFTRRPDADEGANSQDSDIVLNVFVAKSSPTYVSLEPTVACEVEGGEATLRAFFYAETGEPSTVHIGAICGWDQTHAGADCANSDEVRFFKIDGNSLVAVDMEKYKKLLYNEVKPSKKASYTCSVPKFKTARDVKALLAGKQ